MNEEILSQGIRQRQQLLNSEHSGNPRCRVGFLYHAVTLDKLASIMVLGLGAKQEKNFKQSADGVVYLSITWDSADSYAAEYQRMKKCTHCILEVDCLDLPLEVDPNERTQWFGGPISFQYTGVIPPSRLHISQIRIYDESFHLNIKDPGFKTFPPQAVSPNECEKKKPFIILNASGENLR